MTLVKKTKKPKAKKAGKKPVKKTVFSGAKGSARIEKIDRRLRPTPEPKLVKIDPMLKNPLKIVDVPRSQLIPSSVQMFSGQDSSNINKRLDIISSREQQLESKLIEFKKEFNDKEKEVKALEDLNAIQALSQETDNLKSNFDNENYDFIKSQINSLLSDKLSSGNRDILTDLKYNLKNIKEKHDLSMAEKSMPSDIFSRFKGIFSKKETKTLLDDKIEDNDLVDEANDAKSKIRVSNINLLDDEIYDNKLMDNKQILSSEMDDLFGNI